MDNVQVLDASPLSRDHFGERMEGTRVLLALISANLQIDPQFILQLVGRWHVQQTTVTYIGQAQVPDPTSVGTHRVSAVLVSISLFAGSETPVAVSRLMQRLDRALGDLSSIPALMDEAANDSSHYDPPR